jgi:hypothetical protein
MSKTDTITAEGTPGSEFVAKRERELLERHKPVLRFDRQYDFCVASVLGIFINEGNVLRTRRGERVIASRIVVGAPRVCGTPVRIPLPTASAQPAVYGSNFNALRLRSAAVRARELPK